MRNFLVLSTTFLLASAAGAQGVTYFVDAVNGSDTNPGTTRALAVQSITYATSLMQDDDALIVLPGRYAPSTTGEVYPIQIGATASQKRLRIMGEGGPAVTILDGEQQMASAGVPILRTRWDADGTEISGLTFENTGSASYWSMAIRLGSTSGNSFATQNIDISGCVFRNVHRAIVVFGTDPLNPNQTSGIRIHDNIIDGCSHRGFAMWGNGTNSLHNNTILNSGHDSIWVDSLFGQTSATVVANNVVVGSAVGGIAIGTAGTTATIENNNAFNNFADYTGFTPSPSNTSVDPLFVNQAGGDYHVMAGSPMIESGTTTGLFLRTDLDQFSRTHDSNGDSNAGVDKGAYQYSLYSMTIGGTWGINQTVNFNFQSPGGGAAILWFALDDGALSISPWGTFGFNLFAQLATLVAGASPGAVPVTIPNHTTLLGVRLVIQGGYAGPGFTPLHLLNTYDRTF